VLVTAVIQNPDKESTFCKFARGAQNPPPKITKFQAELSCSFHCQNATEGKKGGHWARSPESTFDAIFQDPRFRTEEEESPAY
jgi:hypothetical protein